MKKLPDLCKQGYYRRNTETNLTADDLNRHFAKIATDCDYNEDAINSLFDSVNPDSTDQQFVP